MGFGREQSMDALEKMDGDVNQAVDFLLGQM